MASSEIRLSCALAFGAPALAFGLGLACGPDRAGSAFDPNGGDGSVGVVVEAGVGGGDADAPAATMRIAHLAGYLGPIDFCTQVAGTGSFDGPVLRRGGPKPISDASADADAATDAPLDAASAGDAEAGAPAPLGYRMVSRYLVLDHAGPLTVAIVPSSATSCANPIFVADVTLDPGKLVTVALLGSAAPDAGSTSRLDLAAFVDDRTTSPDKARVRVVHGAITATEVRPPLTVRAVASKAVTIAERVEPKKVSAASATVPVDALGYATIAPLPQSALAIAAAEGGDAEAGAGWQSATLDLGLRGGSLHTAFVLAGEDKPFEVVWCADTSTSGDTTACDVVR